jgi:hypothetical protein
VVLDKAVEHAADAGMLWVQLLPAELAFAELQVEVLKAAIST